MGNLCIEWKTEPVTWTYFFSHLLWKEIVSSLEIHIPLGKVDQISADRELGSG